MSLVFGETLLAYVWVVAAAAAAAFYVRAGLAAEAAALGVLAVALALVSRWSTTVIVGADGIVVRWLGVSRFLPYASIVAVEPHVAYAMTSAGYSQRKSSGVMLRRVDGTSTYLVCAPDAARDLRAAAGQALLDHRRRAPAEVPELRRGARSVAAWARDLRGLLGAQGYRDARPTTEALWNLVENPKNDMDERAAAALALRAHLGDEARPRLRVAIDSCASPRLRVALEAIAEEDEAETARQLRRLSDA